MAELALGIVSLTFEVFSGCVQGYQLITDAKHMPTDCQHLRVRLKTEQYRLLDWADVVKLDETDESLLVSNSSKGLLLDVLDQQRRLLRQFGRLDEKYKKLTRPLLVEFAEEHGRLPNPPAYSPESPTLERADTDFARRFPQSEILLKKSLAYAAKAFDIPRKLKWASFDRVKMEKLVLQLSTFNDYMREMLNSSQLETLAIKQTRTEFQIMQLNSSVQDLAQIINSTFLSRNTRRQRGPSLSMSPVRAILQARGLDDSDDDRESYNPELQSLAALAQTKALNSAIDDPTIFTDEFTHSIKMPNTASEIRAVELDRKHIHIIDEEDEDNEFQRVEAYYQRPHGKKTSVWIEWNTYEPPTYHHTGPDPKLHERVKALVALLRENNRTNQFRAPHCLGYFQDLDPDTGDDHYRFGIVFEKPSSAHPSTRPTSLHTLLTTPSPALEVPSLTSRIALMCLLSENLERLHAVNWLHKGLRSSNILFFSDSGNADIEYNLAFISGFDYSRPALSDDMTEKPPESAREDIYRHPAVQGSGNREGVGGRSYRKSFDLYALGVILLEIAYWKPIDQILGIENLRAAKPSVTYKARARLLDESEGYLRWVNSHLGGRVVEVVRACLEGPQAFGLVEGDDEKLEEVGARLQRGFYEKVVRVLQGVRV
ncbi:hypothetical protein BU24DRAFT_448029 [Aaosphaeria arxii CBS 175.79]|uniref:Protein kinase domain-containing protein n=1 Tax=Aaosphaeria arxii CBS 175.79 TaxID=1450172 RepID=A0A6A5Y261_9PLEO|nr:uncharacterized protein BU24DRAFT_448029 [Aaosphaeria arxii CBS 175.79]KAF2019558.1 hypothetical protein BU24DRAFT_448029 [Aaosphaeria arxii CBS 175.79]